jgi:hypothetical protein
MTVIGALLCVAAVVWHFAVSPVWQERLPPDWTWRSSFIGTSTFADTDGNYPAGDPSIEYERTFRIVEEENGSRAVGLEDLYTNRDAKTGEVVWQSRTLTLADPRTGAYLGTGQGDRIAVFPRHTEKRSYRLSLGYLKDIPMSFLREEEVAGLSTYFFRYAGRMEFTNAYVGTEDYEGIKVEPGQEIKCNDDQFVFSVWVEPTTGEIVKWQESCYAGDAVYDIATGRKLAEVARWGGVSRGEDSVSRALSLRWQRLALLAMTRYLPGLLLLLGVGAFLMGILSRPRGKGASPAR